MFKDMKLELPPSLSEQSSHFGPGWPLTLDIYAAFDFGYTARSISFSLVWRSRRSSYSNWSPIRNPADVPRCLDRRNAVSAVMLLGSAGDVI